MKGQALPSDGRRIVNLQGLLDELREKSLQGDSVSAGDIQRTLGRRAFGPILVIASLPSLTPIATIPALPSVLSLIVIITAGQMLLGRDAYWLPQAVLNRSISRDAFLKVTRFLLPVARFIDRLARPRLHALVVDPFPRIIALCCCLLAVFKVPLEFVPFTGGIPAFPIVIFGLALMSQDGVLVIAGFIATAIALLLLALIAIFGIALMQEAWRFFFG